MFRKKTGRSSHGFTLVEIIVVLVILAILAAILVPALTSYIDKAQQAKWIADGRRALIALQAIAVEEYAKGAFSNLSDTQFNNLAATTTYSLGSGTTNKTMMTQVYELAGLDSSKCKLVNVDINNKGQVVCLKLQNDTNGTKVQVQYLYGTIGGVRYDGVWRVVRWNGKSVETWIDPATKGYRP